MHFECSNAIPVLNSNLTKAVGHVGKGHLIRTARHGPWGLGRTLFQATQGGWHSLPLPQGNQSGCGTALCRERTSLSLVPHPWEDQPVRLESCPWADFNRPRESCPLAFHPGSGPTLRGHHELPLRAEEKGELCEVCALRAFLSDVGHIGPHQPRDPLPLNPPSTLGALASGVLLTLPLIYSQALGE